MREYKHNYPSDITRDEFEIIRAELEGAKRITKPRDIDLYDIFCAILYESILVSTDLAFSAEEIIRLYSYRFKIEVSFRSLKQTIAGFSYHFWTRSMPKLNRYRKPEDDCPLTSITDETAKTKIMASLKAIEGFTLFSCIAPGLLQMLSILLSEKVSFSSFRWLRTKSNSLSSEAMVADFMRKTIFSAFHNLTNISIHGIIKSKQDSTLDTGDSFIA